jgi:hypothetical protein
VKITRPDREDRAGPVVRAADEIELVDVTPETHTRG